MGDVNQRLLFEPPTDDIMISRERALPSDGFAELVAESERDGFRFLRRLVVDWESGSNQFALPGEALFVARYGALTVGLCGLNVDPYSASAHVGRVRHLYVIAACRRRGIGRRLVQAVMAASRGVFQLLRLRTEAVGARRFYLAQGFRESLGDSQCTHFREIRCAAG